MTEEDLKEAMRQCDADPAHIPGSIQNVGALMAFDPQTHRVSHVSMNAEKVLGRSPMAILSRPFGDLMDSAAVHNINNALARLGSAPGGRISLGTLQVNGRPLDVGVCRAPHSAILEFDEPGQGDALSDDQLQIITGLMGHFEQARTERDLMNVAVQVLRAMTGYDRVLAYRFDADFNGEVIAEARSARLPSYLNQRFPQWDIPSSVREIMKQIPLRFIADAQADPIPLLAASPDLPPLDMTYAHLRAVAPLHRVYLKNMELRATATLSLVFAGKLWGIIAFHHARPRVPSRGTRQVLTAIAPLLGTKLESVVHLASLEMNEVINKTRRKIQSLVDVDVSVEGTTGRYSSVVFDEFGVDGLYVALAQEWCSEGHSPSRAVIDDLLARAEASPEGFWKSDSLPADLGVPPSALNDICGAIVLVPDKGRAVCVFRREIARNIVWAGAPAKDVTVSDGIARLNPRASFAAYAEKVAGRSQPWSQHDVTLMESIAHTLLSANQRSLVLASLRRQQDLVVDELNHRVRNLLALVRSISRQARKHNSSLNSYSAALEQRMNALAVAHDLATGVSGRAVSITEILRLESKPYIEGRPKALTVVGPDFAFQPEYTPLVALVVHEMTTNAAKYGALSTETGVVNVELGRDEIGATLSWQERSGPAVDVPSDTGFGSLLIRQAVPFELGGTSEVCFEPDGLTARFQFPDRILRDIDTRNNAEGGDAFGSSLASEKHVPLIDSTIMILEDNYMIAKDLSDNLRSLGYTDIEMVSNLEDARDLLGTVPVGFAILDINLGRSTTSIEIARQLEEQRVPFFFITGYGEIAPLPTRTGLSVKMKLQKPVSLRELEVALNTLLAPTETRPRRGGEAAGRAPT